MHNILFLGTALKNPGMAPRDPNVHDKHYLENIAKYDKTEEFCNTCNIIKPCAPTAGKKAARGAYRLHHCCGCGVCTIGFDHHCAWSGKCISGGNLNCFFGFLGFLCLSIVVFWVNLILGSMETVKTRHVPHT